MWHSYGDNYKGNNKIHRLQGICEVINITLKRETGESGKV
jgi:hypothetical protein